MLCLLLLLRRFASLLPAAVAADGELLRLGQQLLQQLDILLPHTAAEDPAATAAAAAASGTLGCSFSPVDHSRSSSSRDAALEFGMRLSEFAVWASILSALVSQQPTLTHAVSNFFSLRLHASAAAPPPPWSVVSFRTFQHIYAYFRVCKCTHVSLYFPIYLYMNGLM